MTLQRVGQQIGKDLRVLRAHVNPGMDPAFLLSEFKQKFCGVMSNLEEIGIASFQLSIASSLGKIFLFYAASHGPIPHI